MRALTTSASLVFALVLSGCGGSGGTGSSATKESAKALTPAQVVQAAATSAKGSSRLDISTVTVSQGQTVTMKGSGLFDSSSGSPVGEMAMTLGPVKIQQRMVGGVLYLKVGDEPAFYRLPLKELVGTSLGDSANPASAADLLTAMSDDTKKVGTETLRGEATTHYRGTITVEKALATAKNDLAKKAIEKLRSSGVTQFPADVYIDGQGRLRRLLQVMTLTVQGTKAEVTTQIDLYDFGVPVKVQAPPANQTKDGTALLETIKSQFG